MVLAKKITFNLALSLSALALIMGVLTQTAGATSATAQPTIVGTAVAVNKQSGEFSTLIKALTCTGLDRVLDFRGLKFTVFAPTDAAFDKLELNEENVCSKFSRRQLTNILLYHVNLGAKDSTQVLARKSLLMTNLQFAKIDPINGTIAGQKISTVDVRTSNGIIHIIDGVMIPPRL